MDISSEDMDVPSYELNTTSWIDDLVVLGKETQQQSQQKELELVVVAVARKMARLMEYHLQNEGNELSKYFTFSDTKTSEGESQSNSNSNVYTKKFPIITEHAIPFYLSDKNSSQTRIVIVDDFIASGDTVETISENIYAQTGIKPFVIAMAAEYGFDRHKLRFVSNNETFSLRHQPVQPFMAICSRDILSLKRSIDIEHTILTINIPKGEKIELIKQDLEYALRSIYSNADVYRIDHIIPVRKKTDDINIVERDTVTSITVLFNQESNNVNNDFNKLRFFIGDDKLRIVSYAPNIWIGSDLNKDSFDFLSDELNRCWLKITTHINNIRCSNAIDDNDPGDAYRLKSGFEYRNELSKVVLSNYLCSFENILRRKTSIMQVLERVFGPKDLKLNVCEEDLNLLVGTSFAKKILPDLKRAIDKIEYVPRRSYPRLIIEDIQSELMVPDNERDNYSRDRIELLHLSPSFSTTLSLLFERLRKRFEYNRTQKQEDRIKVGETFESLLKLISQEPIYCQDAKTILEIHKWIDTRIDLGVVIPKYERFSIPLGSYVWRRFFRAGEREDVMVDVARLVHYILVIKYGYEKTFDIESESSELLKKIHDLQKRYIGQIPIGVFDEIMHRIRQEKYGANLTITILWHYMLVLDVLSHVDNAVWNEVKLNKIYSYSDTSLYKNGYV